MYIDYYTLKLIWWLFVGVLLIGFALLGGFDLGVGTLLPSGRPGKATRSGSLPRAELFLRPGR